ncbi:MAG: amidohydrolase family protein [Ignavibacteriae bacterium]|nr:amidohydrolase family protein [Ignavibacteriota bacterium]
MKTLRLVFLALFLLSSAYSQRAYVLEGATVIDGIRNIPIDSAFIVVEGQRIIGVGKRNQVIIPERAERIDVRGTYIIPGLIDAHIHYESPRDLVQLLAWGVTSANCMFESTDRAKMMEEQTAGDTVHAPQLYATAPIFTVEGGWWWGREFPIDSTINRFPETPEEAREQIRKVKAKGFKRIKIMYDDMDWCRHPLKPLKRMNTDLMHALLDEGRNQRLLTLLHAPKLQDAREALEAGAFAFVHGIIDERIDAVFLNTMFETQRFYVPTFCLFEFLADVEGFIQHVLSDERLHSALTANDIKKYTSPEYYTKYHERYPNSDFVRSHLNILRQNMATLAREYVLIAMGTDMWAFPGMAAHLELEYMVQAGLTPMQALVTATSMGGIFLGEGNRVGTIQPGARADLLILEANPLEDIRNTRSIKTIIKHGKFFDPKKLIEESKQ